jgi:coenzyme PQQ precursor peptide PqqA
MLSNWTKPDYQEINVGAECTAYSAARAPTSGEQVDDLDVAVTRPIEDSNLHPAPADKCLSCR